jgi:myosin heavy subunit
MDYLDEGKVNENDEKSFQLMMFFILKEIENKKLKSENKKLKSENEKKQRLKMEQKIRDEQMKKQQKKAQKLKKEKKEKKEKARLLKEKQQREKKEREENEKLKSENEKLKSENEKLKSENEKLKSENNIMPITKIQKEILTILKNNKFRYHPMQIFEGNLQGKMNGIIHEEQKIKNILNKCGLYKDISDIIYNYTSKDKEKCSTECIKCDLEKYAQSTIEKKMKHNCILLRDAGRLYESKYKNKLKYEYSRLS